MLLGQKEVGVCMLRCKTHPTLPTYGTGRETGLHPTAGGLPALRVFPAHRRDAGLELPACTQLKTLRCGMRYPGLSGLVSDCPAGDALMLLSHLGAFAGSDQSCFSLANVTGSCTLLKHAAAFVAVVLSGGHGTSTVPCSTSPVDLTHLSFS